MMARFPIHPPGVWMRRSPWLNKARMDWCVQRQFDYNTLVLRAGNYMRDQTGLAMLVRSAGDFCCDRLASRRYGVRVSTRPSQGRNPGSNPGIATNIPVRDHETEPTAR